jgi:hypothetical protein
VDLARADALYDQILADWPDLTKQPECYELLDSARAILEEIDDPRSLARVHLLVARNASTEKDPTACNREIAITRDLWRKAGCRRRRGQPLDDRAAAPAAEARGGGSGAAFPDREAEEDWQRVPLGGREGRQGRHIKTPAFATEDPRTWSDFAIGGNATHALPVRLHPFGRTRSRWCAPTTTTGSRISASASRSRCGRAGVSGDGAAGERLHSTAVHLPALARRQGGRCSVRTCPISRHRTAR